MPDQQLNPLGKREGSKAQNNRIDHQTPSQHTCKHPGAFELVHECVRECSHIYTKAQTLFHPSSCVCLARPPEAPGKHWTVIPCFSAGFSLRGEKIITPQAQNKQDFSLVCRFCFMVCKIHSAWNQTSTNKEAYEPLKCKISSSSQSNDNLIYTDFIRLIFISQHRQTDMRTDRHAEDQLSGFTKRQKNKSGPRFPSNRQHKLNHADSVLSTHWRANWRLCAPHSKLNNLLSPRNYMCILLIYFAIYLLWKT